MKHIKTESGTFKLAGGRTGQIKPDWGKSRLIKVVFMKISLKDQTERRVATSPADETSGRQFWIGLTDLKLQATVPGAGALRCL